MEARNMPENPNTATQSPATTVALPSHKDLVEAFVKIENEEIARYGKEYIFELPEPRCSELKLIDSIMYYLHNPEMMEEDGHVDEEKAKENRDVLAGSMFFVCNEIYNSYYIRSANNSFVYTRLREALAAFDFASENKAVAAFANYFIKFNIPDILGPKSLNGIYTVKQIIDAIPNEVMTEIRQKTSPVSPIVAKTTGSPSLLSYVTFGVFGQDNTRAKPIHSKTAEKMEEKNIHRPS